MTERVLTLQEFRELRYYFALILKKTRREEYNLATCKGKSRFETRGLAVSTISYKKRHQIHAYHCPACQGWHVGSRVNHDRKTKADRRILNQRREQCE